MCVCQTTPDPVTGGTYSGAACTVITYPPPPPPPTCGNYSDNCTDCQTNAFIVGLDCSWCPAGISNLTQYLTNGSCIPTNSTCPATSSIKQCSPPPVISLNPCPDNCLNNGVCTNYTIIASCFDGQVDGNETDKDCGGSDCYPCKPGQVCKVDTDCFTNLCDNKTLTCDGSGFFQTGGNASAHCVCNAGFSGSNCGIAPLIVTPDAVIIGSALSAVAIVGIVIGAALFCALAGGGTLAVYNKATDGGLAPVMSNPLYTAAGTEGINPLHRQG